MEFEIKGWNEERIPRVINYYENQTEDEAVVEDETLTPDQTLMQLQQN